MNSAILTAKLETVEYRPASAQQDAFARVMGLIYNPHQKAGQPNAFPIHFVAYKNNAEVLREHSNQACLVEGRIGITTTEMPAGYKEKAAHVVVEKIIPLGIGDSIQAAQEAPDQESFDDVPF